MVLALRASEKRLSKRRSIFGCIHRFPGAPVGLTNSLEVGAGFVRSELGLRCRHVRLHNESGIPRRDATNHFS